MCWTLKKLFDAIFSKWDVNRFSSFSYKEPHKKLSCDIHKWTPQKKKPSWQKPPQADVFVSYISIPCSVKNWLDDTKVPRSL